MFRILVVEDDTEKLRNILQVLNRITTLKSDLIDHELDVLSAKKRLLTTNYDLLILDIHIPLSKDREVDPLGGVKLLEEITRRDIYKLPTHIFGLTGKEELFQEGHPILKRNIITLIKYSVSDIEWQENLVSGIQQRIASKNAALVAIPEYDWDVAIVCALESELNANLENGLVWEMMDVAYDDTIYYRAILKIGETTEIRIVAACSVRMGMPAAGALAMKMIILFRPKYIVMTGIMAGVTGRVKLGDVVIFDPSWDWGSGKWIAEEEEKENERIQKKSLFLIDPYQFTLDTRVKKIANLLTNDSSTLFRIRKGFGASAPKNDSDVHIGAVASGAAVLSDHGTFNKIKEQHRKLLGVDMEAYALFSAAEAAIRPKPVPICIKAVVDYGDSEKDDDFQAYGSYLSAQLALEIITRLFST